MSYYDEQSTELDTGVDSARCRTVDDYEPTPVAMSVPPATGRGSYVPEPAPRRGTIYVSSTGRHRAHDDDPDLDPPHRDGARAGLRVWCAVIALAGAAVFVTPFVIWRSDRTITVTGVAALVLFFGVALCLIATAVNALLTARPTEGKRP